MREMQTKTASHHCTPMRGASTQTLTPPSAGVDVDPQELSLTAAGNAPWDRKTVWPFPTKLNILLPKVQQSHILVFAQILLGIWSPQNPAHGWDVKTAQTRKQPRGVSIGEWIHEL